LEKFREINIFEINKLVVKREGEKLFFNDINVAEDIPEGTEFPNPLLI